jgi:ABC-type uncharacterized transport system involved in gliding motility auxiliary subunit
MNALRQLAKFFFKNSVWLGIGLISAACTSGLIAGWTALQTGLTIVGIVLIGIWLLMLGRFDAAGDQPNFWQRRSTQAGTGALISTVSVFVILALLNFMAVRHLYRVDLTDTGRLSIAPETQQVLKNLKQPVTLYLFDKEQSPEDRELLQNFRRQSPNFSFEFVDPDANPALAKKFDIKNSNQSRDVHLELPSKNRKVFVQSLSPQQPISESRLVSSLLQIESDRKPRIYFTQGHGERSLDPGEKNYGEAFKLLQDKNFEVLPLNLAQTLKVPIDAAAVVLAGPSKPFFDAELKAIQDYLDQSGNLMVLIDPESQTNLTELLKTWGLVLDNRVAIDASGSGQLLKLGPAAPIVQDYNGNQHPITKEFGNNITFYPLSRPIEIQEVAGVQATPIALTNKQSWGESNLQEKPIKFDAGDRPGPLPLAVALVRQVTPKPIQPSPSPSPSLPPVDTNGQTPPVVTPSPTASPTASPIMSPSSSPSPTASPSPAPTTSPTGRPTTSPIVNPIASPTTVPRESRLVIFGNSAFATDAFFGAQLNGDMFLNSVTWVSQADGQALSIRPREIKRRQLSGTPQQVQIVMLLSAVLLPIIGFGLAALIGWRRR